MNVSFNKAACVAAATLAALVLTNTALAAVSLGYPKGRPYFGFQNQRSMSRTYNNYAPSYSTPAEDTRQSFSYEPTESAAADDAKQPARASDDAGQAGAEQRTTIRRSYSYEPTTPSTTRWRSNYRGSSALKEPWQYQKTDPRRLGR